MDSISKDEDEAKIAAQIVTNYSTLRDNRTLSDILIIVEDSEFHLHRVVLASASEFFRAALSHDMKEAREGKITLHGVDKKVFSSILDLVYCGKNIVTEENFFEIWAAADMLQIKMIIPYCQRMMKSTLSTKNAISYLSKVRAFDEDSKRHVLQLICKSISSKAIYLKIKSMHKDEMKYFLTSEEVQVSEDRLVGFLLSWVKEQYESSTREHLEKDICYNDTEDLRIETQESFGDCIAELLECIRFYLVSESCLHGTLMQHPLVQGNQKCEALFKKITWYQSQSQVQQSWCPPAAICRKHNAAANVLLVGKVHKRNEGRGRMSMIILKDMKWKNCVLEEFEKETLPVLYYDSKIHAIDDKNLFSTFLCDILQWRRDSIPFDPNFVRVVGKKIFFYDFQSEENRILITEVSNSTQLHQTSGRATLETMSTVDTRLKGMSIQEVTSIWNTHVVFLSHEDLDSYTIVCISEIHFGYKLH